MSITVSEPGIYEIPELDYHADTVLAPELGRSLSVSGAKKILQSPARFAYEREHGQGHKDAFDIGHAAHALILGTGLDLVTVDADDWRGKAAREARDEARAEGKVPLLRADMARAQAMADAVRAHPTAAAILSEGFPEQSAYWIDEATGVTRRARFDWIRTNAIGDLKTCADASPGGFARAVANFGYAQQAAWYQDAAAALVGPRPFVFIAVEKEPPHLVAVYQLSDSALDIGRELNARALETYATCESTGVWPGYSTEIETLTLPRWYAA